MGKHRKNPDRPEPDYEVGYQKPPEEHVFKPGHKGHPRKRSKPVDIHELLAKALMRKATVRVDGKPVSIPLLDAMIHQLTTQLANNPAKYLKANLPLVMGALSANARGQGFDENGVDLTAEYRRRIEQLAERQRMRKAGLIPAPDPEPKGER